VPVDSDGFDDDALDDLYDRQFHARSRRRSPRRPDADAPVRVVAEGRSGRSVVDIDEAGEGEDTGVPADDPASSSPYSSYDVATHGPEPAPGWLVTALSARDTPLGDLKSGKEADVGVLERAVPNGPSCLLAVKTYRTAEHRMFHRDAGYVEGRRVRRSRETRAMAKRTAFGRDLLAGRWAVAEFGALSALWTSGARVPYPVQLIGSELMMQFIGTPDGTAAPRLASHDGTTAEFADLWHDLVATLEVLAADGMTHGVLSAYNVLVDEVGCVLIDLPQVVDLIGNPQGMSYLARDCHVIAEFFTRRGVDAADGDVLTEHLREIATPAR
jgi:RIO kinase 1